MPAAHELQRGLGPLLAIVERLAALPVRQPRLALARLVGGLWGEQHAGKSHRPPQTLRGRACSAALSVLRVTWHAALELLRHSAEALKGDGSRLLLRGGHANARSRRAAAERRRKLQGDKRRAVAHERQREQQHAAMRHCSALGARGGHPVGTGAHELNFFLKLGPRLARRQDGWAGKEAQGEYAQAH